MSKNTSPTTEELLSFSRSETKAYIFSLQESLQKKLNSGLSMDDILDEEDPFDNDIPDTGGVPIAGYIEIDMSEDDYSDDGWAAVLEIQREIQL